MSNFEKATRAKLRFETQQGFLSVEELWDLSPVSLNTIAQKVNKLLRDEGEESFLPSASTPKNTQNVLRLDILKYIIETKVAEQDAKKVRAEKAARLAKLKELAENKASEEFASQSLDDIFKQIGELEAQLV